MDLRIDGWLEVKCGLIGFCGEMDGWDSMSRSGSFGLYRKLCGGFSFFPYLVFGPISLLYSFRIEFVGFGLGISFNFQKEMKLLFFIVHV